MLFLVPTGLQPLIQQNATTAMFRLKLTASSVLQQLSIVQRFALAKYKMKLKAPWEGADDKQSYDSSAMSQAYIFLHANGGSYAVTLQVEARHVLAE